MNNVKIKTLLTTITLFISILSFADQEQSTYAYVSTSKNGRYYFIMLLHPTKYYYRNYGIGKMMAIQRNGKSKLLWTIKGWYAFKTYISHDGKYLVRMGNWPRGRKPSKRHLAVAFYKWGRLLKKYSTKDLIKDPSKIDASVSHYRVIKKIIGFKGYSYRFSLITVDNYKYTFNVKTGKTISVKKI